MSTPTKRGLGVRAPFKSPLRPNSVNVTRNSELSNSFEVNSKNNNTSNRATSKADYGTQDCETPIREIERLKQQLMKGRVEPLNPEKELELWRIRMHKYNEAKDACLQLFGLLAHAKGCLIRELYIQYGLDLDD